MHECELEEQQEEVFNTMKPHKKQWKRKTTEEVAAQEPTITPS